MNGFISGATGFLGRMLAKHLIGQNCSLTLSGRNIQELELLRQSLLEQASSPGAKIAIHVMDFSAPESIARGLGRLEIETFDWCINAAGQQGIVSPDLKLTHLDYRQNLDVNLFSPIELTRYFSKHFSNKQKGKIIHFSGGGSSNARPYFSPYSLSKTALVRYIENTSLELREHNVQVFAVSPGLMPSKMLEESSVAPEYVHKDEYEKIKSTLNTRENYDGIKILNLLDFLLSDSANFCTGRLISAQWDDWSNWKQHRVEFEESDLYTLRRITARDRGQEWG
jgi:short-subunit dehydrogenase